MRRTIAILAVVATACTSGQELAQVPSTTTATAEAPNTTTTTPVTSTAATVATSTTVPPTTTTTLPPLQGLAYEEVASVDFPIQLVPWTESMSMLATKDGQVYLYDGERLSDTPVLDISGQVRNRGEQGFLSLAVHPEVTDRVFIHYSANDGDTVVSEFTWDNGALTNEQVMMRLGQPAGNHNGGMLQVDGAGNLYLGLGDGGGSNDRFGNGQNTDTLFGGLVKFVLADSGAEPLLWQYGLRNPWRFWIDGDLIYIADVGQNAFEEISVAPIEAQGINYGWPITEGLHCFSPSSGCDTTGLTLPAVEVSHSDSGTCSITGGIVYRGAAIPEVDGHFFYSDFCGGYLRSFRYEDGAIVDETDWSEQVGEAGPVASFGVDHEGEVYVLTTGRVLKVVPVR